MELEGDMEIRCLGAFFFGTGGCAFTVRLSNTVE